MKKNFYIAELNLPNTSAYTVHVFQMCNFLSKKKGNVKLLIPFVEKKLIKKIKKSYAVKYDFEIISVFNSNKKMSFFKRIYFAYKCKKIIGNPKNTDLTLSRSIIAAIILAFYNIKTFLEIHTELKGVTKYFFKLSELKNISKNLKFIFINKYLLNFFKIKKKKFIILDDAVNTELFINKKTKIYKNTCAYFGSLTKGKGLEIILELSKLNKKINFHIYGDLNIMFKNFDKSSFKNVKFFNHLDYYKIPKYMSKYHVLLMPYLNKVSVRSSNLDTSKYMSPLKLFEYLAMSKIIIASKLKVYSHILKNKNNCLLLDSKNTKDWIYLIKKIFKNLKKFDHLKKSAFKTSRNFTWEQRVEKIINFN